MSIERCTRGLTQFAIKGGSALFELVLAVRAPRVRERRALSLPRLDEHRHPDQVKHAEKQPQAHVIDANQ